MNADEIVQRLRSEPLHTLDDARSEAEQLPGLYAWWVDQGALPVVPMERHAHEPYGLLYVGIAPDSERSRSSLRKRIRQHSDAAVGSSTFRYGLAALLCERAGWRVVWTDRPKLADDDLAALGQWQRTHLRVSWIVAEQPWLLESTVVRLMRPPMNREHNESHPFYEEMGKARTRFRNLAKASAR